MNLQVQAKTKRQGEEREKNKKQTTVENMSRRMGRLPKSSVAQRQSTKLAINHCEVLVLFTKQYKRAEAPPTAKSSSVDHPGRGCK